jgi:hypothetical protein
MKSTTGTVWADSSAKYHHSVVKCSHSLSKGDYWSSILHCASHKFELTVTTTQWRQQGMVLFPPPYQIAEESMQSLQNKMWCRQVFFFFISTSRPTKMVMNIRNPKDIISEA